ncbi:MAG: hypothetical protein LBF27_28485 [Sphingobacterium sp.]|jgi:hypothetical protein|nr:hypothetical protein [Sphingobacterium sp.]
MTEFKELIKKQVDKLFLIVWPPWGEERESDIDISFGFVFKNEPNILCIISVDKDELWSPHISFEGFPEIRYSWEDFYPKMKMWMKADDDSLIIDKEYYEVTKSELFDNIVGNEIKEIEFMNVEGNREPFGVKLHFENDYIISMPNSDGNTVETKVFNKNNSIYNFKHLGHIVYSKI